MYQDALFGAVTSLLCNVSCTSIHTPVQAAAWISCACKTFQFAGNGLTGSSVAPQAAEAGAKVKKSVTPAMTLAHMTQLIMPQHANSLGITFGGQVGHAMHGTLNISDVKLGLSMGCRQVRSALLRQLCCCQ